MTDAQHREQVRREAIAMGWAPALAAYLAEQVGRAPTPAEREPYAPRAQHAALRTTASNPRTTDGRRQCIAEMFGATALVPEFKAAGVPLRHVVSMLVDATGSARSITPAGMDRVRIQLMQRGAAA